MPRVGAGARPASSLGAPAAGRQRAAQAEERAKLLANRSAALVGVERFRAAGVS